MTRRRTGAAQPHPMPRGDRRRAPAAAGWAADILLARNARQSLAGLDGLAMSPAAGGAIGAWDRCLGQN